MAWIEPKTDWVKTDYFSYRDWNRWVNNTQELRKLACKAYPDFNISDMPTKGVNDFPYADEVNLLEQNISLVLSKMYRFTQFIPKTYEANRPTLDYNEANIIESAMLAMYNGLNNQIAGKKRLAFRLGGGIFQ